MWRTAGHPMAVKLLDRSLIDGRLAHAYLLSGPPHVGKMTLALELAQAVNCLQTDKPCGQCAQCRRIAERRHADVQVITLETQSTDGRERTRAEIGIDQVREMQRVATLKPYEGSCRVFIFDGVERLSDEAANCLLKTLEEPPDQVLLVLLTAKRGDALLPTIVSRCQVIGLHPLPVPLVAQELIERWETDPERAEELARLSEGRLGWAVRAVKDPDLLRRRQERLERIVSIITGGLEERFAYAGELASLFLRDRESVGEELKLWLACFRDLLVIKEGVEELVVNTSLKQQLEDLAAKLSSIQIVDATKATEQVWEHLEQNANPRLALEVWMLALPFFEERQVLYSQEGHRT